MPRIPLFVGCVAATLFASSVRADGLIYYLPKDGASATFAMEYKAIANGNQDIRKGTFTISSVGQATVENEKCRWIEFKEITKFSNPKLDAHSVTKLLIPEKHIGKGKSPGKHVIRGWLRHGEAGEAIPVKDSEAPELVLFRTLWLAGPPPEPRELEKAEVDSGPLGKLMCSGSAGTYELVQEGGNGYFAFENRLQEKAPFGLVSSQWKIERKLNAALVEEGTVRFTLIDTNTTAISELLDKN